MKQPRRIYIGEAVAVLWLLTPNHPLPPVAMGRYLLRILAIIVLIVDE